MQKTYLRRHVIAYRHNFQPVYQLFRPGREKRGRTGIAIGRIKRVIIYVLILQNEEICLILIHYQTVRPQIA